MNEIPSRLPGPVETREWEENLDRQLFPAESLLKSAMEAISHGQFIEVFSLLRIMNLYRDEREHDTYPPRSAIREHLLARSFESNGTFFQRMAQLTGIWITSRESYQANADQYLNVEVPEADSRVDRILSQRKHRDFLTWRRNLRERAMTRLKSR